MRWIAAIQERGGNALQQASRDCDRLFVYKDPDEGSVTRDESISWNDSFPHGAEKNSSLVNSSCNDVLHVQALCVDQILNHIKRPFRRHPMPSQANAGTRYKDLKSNSF